ncbi:hypothetical protein [Halorhabdus salina]|uniref:hypothetical protein n=1 Tax=Halorhabdus salina TaxID=2750670 RepID=UPI0015EE7774|nr:hypothetical protein [Halorhabdus salina]
MLGIQTEKMRLETTESFMETEITGSHPDQGIGVNVYDENGHYHWLAIMWDGLVDAHETDDYPLEPADRTDDEQRIMTQVKERAKLAAQQEFSDADILTAEWKPAELDRAMLALEKLHVDDFAEKFRDCYRMLTDPASEPEVQEEESAEILHQPFLVNDDDEVAYVPTPVLQYRGDDGEVKFTHKESRYEELLGEPHLTKFTITLPPIRFKDGDYEFPDGFQIFIIEHLLAQLRDVYRHVGEEPPEYCMQTDIWGKPLTTEDEEYYE